ncbi:MAG TPA: DUF4230 domain-containing protein [Gemmatimonadaceae bacterium]|nr:DUF4230 domain-containing protein [Gemmatimonadaceae bacterium]
MVNSHQLAVFAVTIMDQEDVIVQSTDELQPLPAGPRSRLVGPAFLIGAAALLIVVGFGYCASRLTPSALLGENETNITHDIVVQQIKAVAKLVSSEAAVRDVIVYENTWYGSTKRSLVVVTGRLLAGIDLRDNPDVSIDHAKKMITVRIPSAKLIAVEIRDMQTYDERGGLWNPFTREDRDAIQRQARAKLTTAGAQLEVLRHANESALDIIRLLLAKDGYTVDAALRGR